jgi:FtsZ-binding cell division protein ZapB
MQKVAIDSIVVDERLMIRELDQDIAVDYAAKMKEGAVFPPIVLFKIDNKIYLSSGRHRLEAHKLNAALEIDALIKDGSMDDAYLFALQDNAHHGHKLSQRNITEAVRRMMNHPVWKDWTNTTIAKLVGVTAMTVGRIKKKLEEETGTQPTEKKYVDKNGLEKTVNTAKLATKKVEPEPEVDDDAIGELTDVIARIEEENKKLKDAVALGQFDATDIEKFDIQETLEELREENRRLKIENESLRKSRDDYQKENAELIRTVKSLQKKLKQVA